MAIGHKERLKEGQKPTPTRTYSKKQETAIANATGGQRTPNSGATAWSKGDVLTEQFLLEAKTKTTHSESIKINNRLPNTSIIFLLSTISSSIFKYVLIINDAISSISLLIIYCK